MMTFTSINGHTVLATHLRPGGALIDLGANRGEFSRLAREQFGLRPVLLVEANPDLARSLSANGWPSVVQCAVSAQAGMVQFNLAANDEGSSILSLPADSAMGCTSVGQVQVAARTLESLIAPLSDHTFTLLKVDIEGAENEVLLAAEAGTLKRFAQITVEFHCDPVFGFGGRPEVERVIARLRGLGFDCFRFNGMLSDVLFVNHRAMRLGWPGRLRLFAKAPPPPWVLRCWMALPTTVRRTLKRLFGRTSRGSGSI